MNRQIILAQVVLCLTLFSCADIIVPDDILDEQVELLTPTDGLVTDIQTHTFSWGDVSSAEAYNLRIVAPDFDNPERLVLDSNIIGNSFTLTLTDSDYQWRVVGFNEAYESQFEVFDLSVSADAGNDLTNQIVNLQIPFNDLCTNSISLLFLWDELIAAEEYVLQIGNPDFSDLILDTILTNNFLDYTINEEGSYNWRVRAENQNSQTFTAWSGAIFTIDRTAPSIPVLNSPADGATLDYMNQNPDLDWISSVDSALDSLFIFADASGDTLLFTITLETSSFNLEESTIDFSEINFQEDYYWQVNSTDKSGNTSDISELRSFYIEE